MRHHSLLHSSRKIHELAGQSAAIAECLANAQVLGKLFFLLLRIQTRLESAPVVTLELRRERRSIAAAKPGAG